MNTADITGRSGGLALPHWARSLCLYEVNIRQFTPEGTLQGISQPLTPVAGDGSRYSLAHSCISYQPDQKKSDEGKLLLCIGLPWDQ